MPCWLLSGVPAVLTAGPVRRHRWCLAAVLLAVTISMPAATWAAEQPPAKPDLNERIQKLIEELGNNQFSVRQRAQRELARLGPAAFDALTEAESNDDVEISSQASYLVRLIRIDWIQEGDSQQVKQWLSNYDAKSEQDRLEQIKGLATLGGDAGIGPLCRIARFEASPVLSKQAAVLVLKEELPAESDWPKRRETIQKNVDGSKRPAAQWLRTYIQSHDEPSGAAAAWQQLAEAERKTLEEHPQQTQNLFVQQLLRQEVAVLDRLDQPAKSLAVVRQVVDLERGDPATLAELVEWLAERHAWSVIDDVATRFKVSFNADAALLYTLAQARLAQGNEALAEEAAQQALRLNSDNSREHLKLAIALQRRGLVQWADREFRYLISLGMQPGRQQSMAEELLIARWQLSENLHDRQEDKEAAQVLQDSVRAMDSDNNVLRYVQRSGRNVESIRARMLFFFAEAARREKDNSKALDFLEKALDQDSSDADVLIAMYRLPLPHDRREKLLAAIRSAVDSSRKDIEQHPDEPTAYNQLAWLVANTEGDFDEAIRCSHKSIELRRAGGYLDTLAHCYYAKKDYANAVRYQTEAAKLDPGSAAITRQLKVFKAALAAQQGKDAPADSKDKRPAAPANDKSVPANDKSPPAEKPVPEKQAPSS